MSSNPSEISRGNVKNAWVLGVTLSPVSVANSTSAEQTFALKGVELGDYVYCNKPSNQAGLALVNSRISAKDVLALSFLNTTAATITPTASEVYTVHIARPVNVTQAGVSTLAFP